MSKKNAKGSGSIRKRSDGRWEARYTTGRDAGTGKQIQKSVYGKTQAEVRKKLQTACVAVDEGIYMEPSKSTLGDWLDVWLKEYLPRLGRIGGMSFGIPDRISRWVCSLPIPTPWRMQR